MTVADFVRHPELVEGSVPARLVVMSISADALARMPRISEGFFLGKYVPWGTTYDLAKREFPLSAITERYSARWRICGVEINEAYGLPVTNAEFTAGNEWRPVLHADYEIDSSFQEDRQKAFDQITDAFSKWLGPPKDSRHPEPRYGPAMLSSTVSHWATWRTEDVSLNCSIYGAPRKIRGGRSIGALILRWENEVRAAAPYLDLLQAEEKKLAAVMPHIEMVGICPIGNKPRRYGTPISASETFDVLTAKSQICLRGATILETPATLRAQISSEDVAIWRAPLAEKWGVSTYWDTVSFCKGESARIGWTKLKPAKGSGSSTLCVGDDLWLRGPWNSSQIVAIAQVLQGMPNVLMNVTEDHDC